jgi:hypothetical protein
MTKERQISDKRDALISVCLQQLTENRIDDGARYSKCSIAWVTMLSIEQIQTACSRSEPVTLGDPVSRLTELPLQATHYPFGFPVEIATNSEDILHAAENSWKGFYKLFDTQPIQLRIAITEGHSSTSPPAPLCMVQRNLLSNIADSENFAVCDIAQGFSFLSLTKAAVAHDTYLRYYFLEAAVLCHLATRYTTPIHSACVELNGSGILICGDSGAGKSTLAYACAQAGWTYITDDASYLINHREDRLVVGNCYQARFRPASAKFFPELAGHEVTQRAEDGKPSIELCTAPFEHIARSQTSHVEHIIFLNRRDPKCQELVPFSREVARHFMRQPLFSTPEMMEVQSAAIERLLARSVLELRYHDLAWGVERLTRLITEGR